MIVYAESSAVLAWLPGEPDGDDVRDHLNVAEKVVASRLTFSKEPVRTLDAIHLATIPVLRPASPDMAVLALDSRMRENATLLGFEVIPYGRERGRGVPSVARVRRP